MRRTATAALTAALMLAGTSAALAQPGSPSDAPAPPAQAQGSPATGQERSADAREHASAQSGVDVPANEEARVGGRAFGEQTAADARARGEQETDVTEGDATEDAVDDLEVDGLDDVDLPEQGDEARGVLTEITASVTSLLDTIKALFGF